MLELKESLGKAADPRPVGDGKYRKTAVKHW